MTSCNPPQALRAATLAVGLLPLVIAARVLADAGPSIVPVLEEALAAARTIDDPKTRDHVLREIACELAHAGQFERAEAVAREIRDANVRCNALVILAEDRAKAGDVAAAFKDIDAIDDPGSKYLRSVALKRVAVAQARRGDREAALKTVQLDPDEASREAAIAEVKLAAEPVRGQTKEAGRPTAALPTGESAEGYALARLAGIMADAGQLDALLRAADRLRSGRSTVFAAVAEARLEHSDAAGAEDAARRALAAGDGWSGEARARVALVRALLARGALPEARRIADGVWKQPKPTRARGSLPMDGDRYRGAACLAIAHALAAQGDVQAAEGALSRRPWRSQFLGRVQLAEARLKAGDRAAAEQLVTDALIAAELGRVGYYYKDLGVAQLRLGQLAAARESFAKALLAHDIGVPSNRCNVVRDQARAGDLDGALRSVDAIPEPAVRAQALSEVASDLAREEKLELARDVAGRIADAATRKRTLASIEQTQTPQRPRHEASAAPREVAEPVKALSPEAAGTVAHYWAANPDGAEEALGWARKLPEGELRARAVLEIARAMAGRPLPLRP